MNTMTVSEAGISLTAPCWADPALHCLPAILRTEQVKPASHGCSQVVKELLAFSAAAVWLYGLDGIGVQIGQMSWRGMVAVAFLAYMAGLLGYAAWGALLARYESGRVAPLSLLVPVIALLTAHIFLNEDMNRWHWAGATMVMLALLVQVFGGRWKPSHHAV